MNPTGRFVVGGPQGDCGLTGRKIIVDTYGGAAPHGGGAFSGKDPSKVDRSAAYAARYVAKNIVAAGLAQQVRGAGVVRHRRGAAHQRHGDHLRHRQGCRMSASRQLVRQHFDLRPKGIVQMLDLLRPIYEKTAAYGHFGRNEPEFTWEKTDKAPRRWPRMQGSARKTVANHVSQNGCVALRGALQRQWTRGSAGPAKSIPTALSNESIERYL